MGEINFNKMNFVQKWQEATANLNAQGKTAPTTADIVKEMVRMGQADKADIDQLPDGFRVEHTAQARAAAPTELVYGSPIGFGDVPQDVSKFMDFIMELLPEIDNLPPEIKNELIDILSEYVDKLENEDAQFPTTEMLYGSPVIDGPSQDLLNLINKLNESGLPKDVVAQILDKIQSVIDNPENIKNFREEIIEILQNANATPEQIEVVLDSLTFITTPKNIYGTPVNPGDDPTENIKKLLTFIKQLQSMDIPPELLRSIVDELKNIPDSKDPKNLIDILDNITDKIKEANLADDKEAELMKAISDFLDEYNQTVVGSICMYGSPVIPTVSTFREMVEKLLPDVNNLTGEWRTALASIIKNVIAILKGYDIEDTSNIGSVQSRRANESGSGVFQNITAFRNNFPEDQYEIIRVTDLRGIEIKDTANAKNIIVVYKKIENN